MDPSAPVADHKARAPAAGEVRVALVTASDSRTAYTNEGGRVLRALMEEPGFQIVADDLLTEEPAALRDAVARLARDSDAVIVTGGTGVAPRDRTPDAVGALFERRLPGFGELFRMLSYQEIGAAAMLSRAQLGIHARRIVVSLPGSPNACRLALEKLLIPELPHLVREVSR